MRKSMIKVHYLVIGRPLYTVWLLEELGLEYELNVFHRNPETMRAPPELREIHPLGKSPVIEDGDLMLSETGAIASYLIEAYSKPGEMAPDRTDLKAWATYTQWLHYPEASAFVPLLMTMLLARDPQPGSAIDNFAKGEVALHLGYLNDAIGDKDYILGDKLCGADIGLGYIAGMAERLGQLEAYPNLQKYIARLRARPAFIRAQERTGEQKD
jgi:glutathione S-transferase